MTDKPQTVKIMIWWVEGGIFAGLLPCLPAFNLTLQKMFGTAQLAFFLQTFEVNLDISRVVLRRGAAQDLDHGECAPPQPTKELHARQVPDCGNSDLVG